MIEGALEDQRIGGKVVGAAAVAPVGIGKDNEPGSRRSEKANGFDIILHNRRLTSSPSDPTNQYTKEQAAETAQY